eukprot:6615-Eustigmatos_ZCMA.PRE.1
MRWIAGGDPVCSDCSQLESVFSKCDTFTAGQVPRQESRVYVLHIVSVLHEVMQDVPRDKLQ